MPSVYIKKADRERMAAEGGGESATEFEPKEKKEKAAPAGKKGKINFTVSEVKDKFNLLFEGVAKVSGREYKYSPEDFTQEASGFVRICEKFPVVGSVFVWFDPVLVIMGFLKKFREMPFTRKKQQPEQRQQTPEGLALVHPPTQQINNV